MNAQLKRFTYIFLLFLFFPFLSLGADLKMETEAKTIGIGGQFVVQVVLNAPESINAIEGKINFPSDILSLKDINDANSLVSFWIDRPVLAGSSAVAYSGIIPGGFRGERALVFSLIFEAKKRGNGIISFEQTNIFRNDGAGTAEPVMAQNFTIEVLNAQGAKNNTKTQDSSPPESFVPQEGRDATLFNGNWFLVFATQDKNSGIDHYEVRESRLHWLFFLNKWAVAQSPYVLQDQKLQSIVWVKAVDKAGNERITSIQPKNKLVWYEDDRFWVIIIGIIIFLLGIRKVLNTSKNA